MGVFANALEGRESSKKFFLLTSLSPLVVYMAIFTLLPVVWAFLLAFFDYSAQRVGGGFLGLGGDNPFVGLQNFENMLAGQSLEAELFRTSLRNTMGFAMLVLPLNLLITIPLAVLIESTHERVKPLFRLIFFLPVVTSAVGVAVMWGFIYHPQNGLLNGFILTLESILTPLGIPPPARQIWLSNARAEIASIPLAMFCVVIAYLWQDFGYNTIIFIAALQGIPDTFKEAARVDGATPWQVFRHITLPLLRPAILLTSVLTMISAFQVFDLIQVLTPGGGQQAQTRVLTIDIYENAFRFQRMGWASAVSTALFLLVLVITLIQFRLLRSEWEY
jgi:multiple sugar transport system permease protein/raffinose/stachyose/melibiose transport system permease protein